MNDPREIADAKEHAAKHEWREREGWCTPEEAHAILSYEGEPIFTLVETDHAPVL